MAHVYTVLFGKQLTRTDVNMKRNCFALTREDFLAFKNVLIPRDRELFAETDHSYPFNVEDFPFSSRLWALNCKTSDSATETGRFAGNWARFVWDKNLRKGSWLFCVWNQQLYRLRINVVNPQEELDAEEQILFDALDDILEDSVVGHTGGTTDPGGAGLEGTADPEGTTGTGGTAVGVQHQALFSFALRSGKFMLKDGPDNKEVLDKIIAKIKGLCHHTRTYYWLGLTQLNNVYRYKTEEYSHTALNKFNVRPESIPDRLFEFMPLRGGYFIGNVSPACMDFRRFLLGNCIAILSSLLTPQQASQIMDLIEERWDEIIEEMPLKIIYPALESDEWKTITGYESKNTWWSYHNGGFWPALLWLLGAACFKTRRPQMARNAIELVEKRLCKDGWSEYKKLRFCTY